MASTSSGKERTYKEAILQWGFTSIVDKNIEKPQKKRRFWSSRMDSTGNIQKANESCLQASYKIAYRIALNKKPHTIEEDLIKPCLLDAVTIVIGELSYML
ncbi:unnamed protein product [Pieris macdunnoughi]|uniref:Uncharacterized protein n=1 Tax=Pieris macdunnoughi TaxID=345717 RepID=A0A821UI49_9NEOP|nr:unnamed protein product [Pieris macdunnoughi]